MPGPKDPPRNPPDESDKRKHEEDELDEAPEETFPASDPISPMQHDD